MILIDELKSSRTPVIAAPLAGYHDPPQAFILSSLGVRHMVYPFVASEGVVKREIYRNEVSKRLLKWKEYQEVGGMHVQMFGRDPSNMAETARFLQNDVIGSLFTQSN